jgi:ACS family allantoate permease-like MFS transporter
MLWGFVLGCYAACTSFADLAICRTLLGIFESCVAPIPGLTIAMWYKKEEQGRRVSWFYVCNSLTQIFAGLLVYGVSFCKHEVRELGNLLSGHWRDGYYFWSSSVYLSA